MHSYPTSNVVIAVPTNTCSELRYCLVYQQIIGKRDPQAILLILHIETIPKKELLDMIRK